jgi:hypothetical protein
MTHRIGLTQSLNVSSKSVTGSGGVWAQRVIPLEQTEVRVGARVEAGGNGVGVAAEAQLAVPLVGLRCPATYDLFNAFRCAAPTLFLTPALAVGVDVGPHPYAEASLGLEVEQAVFTAGVALGLRAPFDERPFALTGRGYVGVKF